MERIRCDDHLPHLAARGDLTGSDRSQDADLGAVRIYLREFDVASAVLQSYTLHYRGRLLGNVAHKYDFSIIHVGDEYSQLPKRTYNVARFCGWKGIKDRKVRRK